MPVTPEERRRIRLEAFADIEHELHLLGKQHIMDEVRGLRVVDYERASPHGEERAAVTIEVMDAVVCSKWRTWAEESVREMGLEPQPSKDRDHALRMELTRALVLGPPEVDPDEKFEARHPHEL